MAAAGKWKVYDFAKKYLADGTFDLDDTTNWKIALFLSTSNANTLSVGTGVYGDLTNECATAFGYTQGGFTLSNVTWTASGATLTFKSGNGTWTASGGSLIQRYAVIYKNATVNGIIKPILCVCLLDTTPANVTVTSGNILSIAINASGIFTLTGGDVD